MIYDLESALPCVATHYRATNEWLRRDEPIVSWVAPPSKLGKDFLRHSRMAGKPARQRYRQTNAEVTVSSYDSTRAQHIEAEQSLDKRFLEHANRWGRETAHLSSPSQIMMHPSYHAVLGMAHDNERELVRLMIYDLSVHRRPWFWALSYLTKENPIRPSDAGKLDNMIKSWVEWGRQKGLL